MDALGHVLDLQLVLQLRESVIKVSVLRIVDMFLLEGADETLGQAVLGRLTYC